MGRAQSSRRRRFGLHKAMRNYLYVRPARARFLYPFNQGDRKSRTAYSITPGGLRAPSHWGLRARLTLLGGGPGTEYGEKYYSRRIELLLHYHF